MNVFVDTNVLLDVVLERQPYVADALAIWDMVEEGRVRSSVSAISFNNADYLVRKISGMPRSRAIMGTMLVIFEVVPLDRTILEQSVRSSIVDFEDAIQYFSVLRVRATHLVTRNPGHFPKDELAVVSPGEFLMIIGTQRQM